MITPVIFDRIRHPIHSENWGAESAIRLLAVREARGGRHYTRRQSSSPGRTLRADKQMLLRYANRTQQLRTTLRKLVDPAKPMTADEETERGLDRAERLAEPRTELVIELVDPPWWHCDRHGELVLRDAEALDEALYQNLTGMDRRDAIFTLHPGSM